MNLYRFINSRDIRKHLEDMKYEFNALEASWLVYQCSIKGVGEYFIDYEEDDRKGTFAVVTRYFKDNDNKIDIQYDFDKRIKAIDMRCIPNDDYSELYSQFFDGFWFDFPTPFRKGDIVYKACSDIDVDPAQTFDFCRGVLVLTDLLPWNFKNDEKRKNYTEGRSGDNSDMTFYGYFQREDGSIYSECEWTYMDLEFYRGPFKGVRRILKALSSFVKGEIEIELLSHAYSTFLEEKRLEDISTHNWFTPEGVKTGWIISREGGLE